MAAVQVASRPAERSSRRKPFAQWVRNLANIKHKNNDSQEKGAGKKIWIPPKHKKSSGHDGLVDGNPYLNAGQAHSPHSLTSSANGQLSFATPSRRHDSDASAPLGAREVHSTGDRSAAPTLNTKPETIHSDAGHSKAATTTTYGGGLSSTDGAGPDSTFSSPNESQHSLTTTLTTIQSTSVGNTLNTVSGNATQQHHGSYNNLNPVMFTHQYPVSPAGSTGGTASAIPRHIAESIPTTYNSATSNGLLTDNASILTLASSSKRRRRSMDTDASVRALAPNSVWGSSRESLPLSVLSGYTTGEAGMGIYTPNHGRPSIGGGLLYGGA